jgi:hypothetical protein
MNIFKRKSQMDKLITELASLRAHAEKLGSRHAAADAAFTEAKARLQHHLLEPDLDADDKTRLKLEAAVASCALTRDNYAEALATQRAKIAELETKITAERERAERLEASQKLANDLDAVEQALPAFLETGRRFADALDAIHFHYETTQAAAFLRSTSSQIEVASAFATQELRAMVRAIADGSAPMPPRKPEPAPLIAPEPAPEIRPMFAMRVVRWVDAKGVQRIGDQYTDVDLTPAAAARGLRCNAVTNLNDPRRRDLLNANGGRHPNPKHALDLDSEEACRPAHIQPVMASDAGLTVIDRGPAITGTISVARAL